MEGKGLIVYRIWSNNAKRSQGSVSRGIQQPHCLFVCFVFVLSVCLFVCLYIFAFVGQFAVCLVVCLCMCLVFVCLFVSFL